MSFTTQTLIVKKSKPTLEQSSCKRAQGRIAVVRTTGYVPKPLIQGTSQPSSSSSTTADVNTVVVQKLLPNDHPPRHAHIIVQTRNTGFICSQILSKQNLQQNARAIG